MFFINDHVPFNNSNVSLDKLSECFASKQVGKKSTLAGGDQLCSFDEFLGRFKGSDARIMEGDELGL